MTNRIEMLPLPEKVALDLWISHRHSTTGVRADAVETHARAVAEHNDKAKDAEIEALRAEREVIVAEAMKYAGKCGRLEAKVERLVGALRHQSWCRACGEDGWNSCEEGLAAIDLLRDHDQEVENG